MVFSLCNFELKVVKGLPSQIFNCWRTFRVCGMYSTGARFIVPSEELGTFQPRPGIAARSLQQQVNVLTIWAIAPLSYVLGKGCHISFQANNNGSNKISWALKSLSAFTVKMLAQKKTASSFKSTFLLPQLFKITAVGSIRRWGSIEKGGALTPSPNS